MRAIIETGGKQFAVSPNQTIRVPSMQGEPGDRVTFDRVLYAAEGDGVHLGAPHLAGASVTAEIVKQGRGPKITVFKYKRRKRYSRKKGHRQGFTELRVTGVDFDASKLETSKKPEKNAAATTDTAEAELFVCPDCGKEYKTERGLQQHASREHA
ncbi:MAG TPA: 50S ribosomal protein L21 [Gemmatimonadota bacterium]|nr:50S ribosomal protein L21 [Gemmatimonadota bacterium]